MAKKEKPVVKENANALLTVDDVLRELKSMATAEAKASQVRFGIRTEKSYGLRVPQIRALAKRIGIRHELALQLWQSQVHEARHLAIFIADYRMFDESLMELWLKDFDSWDVVDNCCGTLFCKSPIAYDKAEEWTKRKAEYEKRAGFVLMAELAVHDKKTEDKKFEQLLPHLIAESHDGRNFVKKAINWALRQIGKRNERLCRHAMTTATAIGKKTDAASRWIATDALRELQRYQKEGRIKNVGGKP